MQEMPPLACDPDAAEQAVFLVTIPISYGRFQLSHSTYRFLAKHVGMSLESGRVGPPLPDGRGR